MLYTPPPDVVVIDDIPYPVDTDFRTWVAFYGIFSETKDTQTRTDALISFLEQQNLPLTLEAVDAVMDFFSGNRENETKTDDNGTPRAKTPPCVDFEKDSEYIFAAFWEVYGIDLTVADLHWYKFLALFRGLPESCHMCKIIHYRAVNINDVPKSQQKFYRKMKVLYALHHERAFENAKERENYMKRRVQESYENAKTKLEQKNKQ